MKLCKLIPISLAAFLLLTGCGSSKSNTEDHGQNDGGDGQGTKHRQCRA